MRKNFRQFITSGDFFGSLEPAPLCFQRGIVQKKNIRKYKYLILLINVFGGYAENPIDLKIINQLEF